jgi:hypothetical protein
MLLTITPDTGTTVAGIGNGPQPADDGEYNSYGAFGAAAVRLIVVAHGCPPKKGRKGSKELGDMVVLEDDLSDDGTGSSYYTKV